MAAAGWARRRRRRRVLTEAGSVLLGAVLLIWSLLPIYNLFLIALDPEEGEVEFTGNIYPPEPDLDAFWLVLTQSDRYLEHFWRQFGNGLEINERWLRPGVTREEIAAGLRPLLELPVEHVLATHGGPTDRAALERALSPS